MTQTSSFVIAAHSTGTDQRTELNDIVGALNTTQKGASRPSTVDTGTMWIDDSGGVTAWLLKFYDRTHYDVIGTIIKL